MPELPEIQAFRQAQEVLRKKPQPLAYEHEQALRDLRQHLQESTINSMSNTIKNDQKVMELLKVTDISRMIASTPLGPLMLQLRKGEKKYRLVLDSVPLEEELNKELMELLFAKDTVPQVNKKPTHILHNLNGKTEMTAIKDFNLKKVPSKGKKKK